MAFDPQVIGAIQTLPGVVALLLLKPVFDNPETPGSRSFGALVCAIALWSFCLGLGKFLPGYVPSIWAYNLVLFAVELLGVAWFLVAVAVTGRIAVSRWLLAGLLGWFVANQIVVWTNPIHGLVIAGATTMDGPVLVPVYGPGFWIHTAGTYFLVLAATILLGAETVRSTGIKRRQAGLLTVAVLPSLIANFVTLTDVAFAPYDMTPFGFLVTAGLFAVALFSGRFLDIVPVARRTAIGEMDDAVVTLDAEGRVIDCNRSARDLFDIDDDYVGTPAADALDVVPPNVLATFEDTRAVDTELVLPIDGQRRHFLLSMSPVSDRTDRGRVIVLREITLLKEREQQLDLMRQVQSRVLRHNLRNELQTIKLANELVVDEVDGQPRRMAERAVERTEDLIDVSEKVGSIDRLVEEDQTPVTVDLRALFGTLVERARASFPGVTFTLDCSADCRVEAAPALELAFENLLENAAEHNDAETPEATVTVASDPGGAAVTVRDNGPGISEYELDVLERDGETPLEHGSGMGLWVVTWIVDSTRARIDYETGPEGTAITVRIPTEPAPSSDRR
jgi:signal transduction histidine kinase